jgi:hypothetical protein
LKFTGEIDVEPGNVNLPLGGLLLLVLQFKFSPGDISLGSDKQPLDLLELSLPLLLLV